jgi:hypothetical protein
MNYKKIEKVSKHKQKESRTILYTRAKEGKRERPRARKRDAESQKK